MNERASTFQWADLVEQGETLVEKAVDVHVIDGTEYMARWYFSPRDADLMIWLCADQKIDRFQLNSGGQIVDWSRTDGLKTGFIVEIELALGEVAETIQFDSIPNESAMLRAKTITENCAALRGAVRDVILKSLLLDASRPVALGVCGVSASRTRFWGRFKRWTIGA